MDNGAIGSMMSGSGPTVFGIFDSPGGCKAGHESGACGEAGKTDLPDYTV